MLSTTKPASSGLLLLVRTLAQKYARLDQEAISKAVSEVLNFAKMRGETVDSVLVHLDVPRAGQLYAKGWHNKP